MKANIFNHVAIIVEDVDASESFYKEVFELEPIPRPDFNFPGAWLGFEGACELHIIGGRDAPVVSDPRGAHFAMEIQSMDEWCAHLASINVAFLPVRSRPDGALQTYIEDPDGYFVELTQLP